MTKAIPLNSICGLGYSAPNAVADALRKFPEEFEAHLKGKCPSGVCYG